VDIAAAGTSFGLLLAMELGDKTPLAVLACGGDAAADGSDAGTGGARPRETLVTDGPMPHGMGHCASVSSSGRPNKAREQQAAR